MQMPNFLEHNESDNKLGYNVNATLIVIENHNNGVSDLHQCVGLVGLTVRGEWQAKRVCLIIIA